MAAFHSCDLSWSTWFGVAKHILGIEALDAGEGESLVGTTDVQHYLQPGQNVHCLGSAQHLWCGPEGAHRLAPQCSGHLLAAMAGMWRDVALNQVNQQKYQKAYKAATGPKHFHVCGFFTCVAYVSVDARTRKIVIPGLTHVTAIFAVVLKGIAFITEGGGESVALAAGSGYVFLPQGPLRVEVDGVHLDVVGTCGSP